MAWQTYQVVFRLRTLAHIGWGKVGNLQRTRPYLTGRVFWGALTMRLTRDAASDSGPSPGPQAYQRMGEDVHQSLAYTYFYPATASHSTYHIAWPWNNPSHFRRRFLSSYSSTALAYPQQSAATGLLHEVEFLSPHTLDDGKAVFLVGYVFEKDNCSLQWQAACQRLQVGGERSYGWGDLQLMSCERFNDELFEGQARINTQGERPVISLQAAQNPACYLLAHTTAKDAVASGDIEPLVGREWRANNDDKSNPKNYIGQHVANSGVCFVPGSTVEQDASFVIGHYGIWKRFA